MPISTLRFCCKGLTSDQNLARECETYLRLDWISTNVLNQNAISLIVK